MSLSVKFNNIELNKIIDVEMGFNPFEGADWDREFRSIPNATGSTLISSKVCAKSITMPFRIKGDVNRKYDELQRILNVSDTKRLFLGNMPNRYFLAVTTGTLDFKEVSAGFIGHGSIKWLIPDGVSYSIDTKIVTASEVGGILTATVINNGSSDVYPTYRIKNNAENGWHGIAHEGGVLEIGNREELDTEILAESVVILNTTDFSEFERYTGTNPENSRKGNDGFATIKKEGDTNYLHLTNAGTNNNYWHGASYVFNFPADSIGHVGAKNVYSYFNAVFWAGTMGQTGQFQVLFADADNHLVMGYDIYKNDNSGNTGVWVALAGDGKGGCKPLATHTFTTSHLDNQNPFNKPRGHCDIYKNGDNLRFYWFGSYPSFVVPELKDVEVTKCYINFYQYGNRYGNQSMNYFDLRKMIIRNDVSNYLFDIKNRYEAGSEIVVDTESANVCVNGLPANNEAVNPPIFAPLKTGTNKIEFYKSDWSQSNPEITVEYKERWL